MIMAAWNRWCGACCPFPKGALHDPGQVRLTQAQGGELPLATTVLATWPDGSIKWLLLDTQVTLRARQILPLVIEYGQDITHTQVTSPLQISPLTDGLRVDNRGSDRNAQWLRSSPFCPGWRLPG